jgi:hypothetical protein
MPGPAFSPAVRNAFEEADMLWVTVSVTIFLLFYLLVALVWPEWF